jgi:AraC-like DNA-binding protein
LQQFLADDSIIILEHQKVNIDAHIILVKHYIAIPPTANGLEEKVIFNYFPLDYKLHLMTLTFLPDYDKMNMKEKIVYQIIFEPSFFEQWAQSEILLKEAPFNSKSAIEQAFTLHLESREYIDYLEKYAFNPTNFIEKLQLHIAAVGLLKNAFNGLVIADESNSYPACSFLNNTQEREKIFMAQDIILQNLSTPLTIRELAKKCGMNECYLKKGFKAMFGKTIYEYREYERIKKSQELIRTQKMNINEVALEMGYASHAYFSTAFKKITGSKPCDLLN